MDELIAVVVRSELDGARARELYKQGPEVVILALLAASKRIAELQRESEGSPPLPSTPSGMVPVYTKPNTSSRRKRPGARRGHPGTHRATPTK